MKKSLVEERVFTSLIKHALPFFASSFLQTLYGMADLIIIGQFAGVAETTAIAIGSQVMHMLTVIIVGLTMGCGEIILSRKKNDGVTVDRKLGSVCSFFFIFSLALMLLSLLFVNLTALWMNTPASAVDGTVNYLFICSFGLPFIVFYNVLSSIYRGSGDSKTPVYFVLVATLVNIILDIVFMGKMGMGVRGAALGTVLSQAVSVIIAAIDLSFMRKKIGVGRIKLSLDKSVISSMMRIGTPIATHDGLIQVAFILITMIINRRGIIDAAAAGIVEKIISVLILVPSALHSSVAVLSQKSLEENNTKRAKETMCSALIASLLFGVAVTVVVQLFSPSFVSFFTRDAYVIRNGAAYLRGYVYETIFAAVHFALSGYFTALGLVGITSVHNIISIVFMRIPGVYFISLLYPGNLYPVGLASASGSLLSAVICIVVYIYLDRAKKGKSIND